mgnify:CR=1 FL=1
MNVVYVLFKSVFSLRVNRASAVCLGGYNIKNFLFCKVKTFDLSAVLMINVGSSHT